MKLNPAFLLLNIFLGVTIISISYFFKKYYPKGINAFMGYRTKRSMSSPEAWLLANKYSSQMLFDFAITTVILQGILNFLQPPGIALACTAVFWIMALFLTIFLTEVKLKKAGN
jgi:hypothetical protein